ncbi:MarR family winged helix-turn-helix transcriptional regulator [Aliidiomarina celeris]|uniref:MarR family winged helix-turn-helix transcriptional regulator n=1 Tax=Aliidiomarina celeris TaxID=2249428 RepID=UPI000DEB08EC|nr:MarR family winged helix-turn-helix transcriptional regulator [Aliidiomarina celeris]
MSEITPSEFSRLSEFRYRLRVYLRRSEEICKSYGVTSLQYQLLLHTKSFEARKWATVGELSEKLQAKHHGTVMLVDRCEALGLVTRVRSESDKRKIEVHLTAKGEALAQRIAFEHRPELKQLKEGIVFPDWSQN